MMLDKAHSECIERAAQLVRSHGTALDMARLDYWLHHQPIAEEIIIAFLAGQRDNGGWPAFWSSGASSIDATCYRLIQAELARYPALSRAIAFLRQRQQADGHWEEDTTLREIAPPWALPGDRAATLYLTANCGFCLAMLERWYGSDGGLAAGWAASDYLLAAVQEDGILPSFLQTQWLAACLWHLAGEHVAMARMFEAVAPRLSGEASPGQLVWFINTVLAADLLGDESKLVGPIVLAARGRLQAAQRPDDSWPSDDGSQFDITTTLEAIYALERTYGFTL